MKRGIVTSAYLGPIKYYSVFANFENIIVEQFDTYTKQTYRNRCSIMAANGKLSLSIPVEKVSGARQTVNQVCIDYATRWQKNHWRSIYSAYNSSPFFEYYAPDFARFYEKRWKYLIDFNMELHYYIMEELGIDCNYALSDSFSFDFDGSDFREVISPKTDTALPGFTFHTIEYTQTFSERLGFVPDLSIIDLLFNLGPEALYLLENWGRCNKQYKN